MGLRLFGALRNRIYLFKETATVITEAFNSPIISIFRVTFFLVGASCARDASVKMVKKTDN